MLIDLFHLFFIASLVNYNSALKCYFCVGSKDCNDPFNKLNQNKEECSKEYFKNPSCAVIRRKFKTCYSESNGLEAWADRTASFQKLLNFWWQRLFSSIILIVFGTVRYSPLTPLNRGFHCILRLLNSIFNCKN